ncbi:hypothetical protein BGZ47_009357 [Haplosporangium gracile]|nr:hypothetical protein BGZ47_009357 [Haplosporangium gracile]
MGPNDLKCPATDPGQTTLYGFGYGKSSSRAQGFDAMILMKSQANPFNVADIKVFSAVSFDYVSFKLERDDLFGIRYDQVSQIDSSGESVTAIGRGKWSAIDLDPSYNQTVVPLQGPHDPFYLEDGDNETLIHVYTDRDRTIHLHTVNELMAAFCYSKQYLTWLKINDILQMQAVLSIAYGNNTLYVYNRTTKSNIVAISLANMNDNTMPTIKQFNANSTSGCQSHFDGLKTWTYKDSYFLFCDHGYPAAATTQDYAQLDTIASTLADTSTTIVKRYEKVMT